MSAGGRAEQALHLGLKLFRKKSTAAAKQAFDAAVAAADESVQGLGPDQLLMVRSMRGDCSAILGMPRQAIEDFDFCISQLSGQRHGSGGGSIYLFKRALAHKQLGNLVEARTDLSEALLHGCALAEPELLALRSTASLTPGQQQQQESPLRHRAAVPAVKTRKAKPAPKPVAAAGKGTSTGGDPFSPQSGPAGSRSGGGEDDGGRLARHSSLAEEEAMIRAQLQRVSVHHTQITHHTGHSKHTNTNTKHETPNTTTTTTTTSNKQQSD